MEDEIETIHFGKESSRDVETEIETSFTTRPTSSRQRRRLSSAQENLTESQEPVTPTIIVSNDQPSTSHWTSGSEKRSRKKERKSRHDVEIHKSSRHRKASTETRQVCTFFFLS